MSNQEEKKELQNEIKELKKQLRNYKKETLTNFKLEKKEKLNECRKEHGKVPKEVKEELKQREQELKQEIKETETEVLQEIKELEDEIKQLKTPKANLNSDRKLGEKKLKKIIGDKIFRNHGFYKKMAQSGIRNTPKAWHKINSQVRKELKEGTLKSDDVEKRVDELVKEISPHNIVITKDQVTADQFKNNVMAIEKKGKISIKIPYQSSGVNDAIVGGAFLGNWGTALGMLTEGSIKWKYSTLLFLDEGITVRSTGQVVLYKDITNVILGEKGVFRTVTVITESKENLVYKTENAYAEASKELIERNMRIHKPQINPKTLNEKEETQKEKAIDGADALIKYAKLYEKNLLTKEEFETKKAEILGIPTTPTNEKADTTLLYCPNCGNKIEKNTKFCTNCGSKL